MSILQMSKQYGHGGGAESANTGKRKYGNAKYEIERFLKNASTANASMNLLGWKMEVWKTQVYLYAATKNAKNRLRSRQCNSHRLMN